jgi:hypothetical protein
VAAIGGWGLRGRTQWPTVTDTSFHSDIWFQKITSAHSPIDMVAETLNLDRSVIARFPKNRPDVLPA